MYVPFRPEVLGSASASDPAALARNTKSDPWDGRSSREEAFIAKLKEASPKSEVKNLNPILDELTKAANAAVGIAQAAGEEAKAAFRSGVDRMATDMDLVRRDEFEALKAELAALRAELASLKPASKD